MSDQSRRPRDTASGAAPMGSTAAIVIAVIAVVLGFIIIRQLGGDDEAGTVAPATTAAATTLPAPTIPQVTDPPTSPPTTAPVDVKEGAVVIVANASTVNGAAGRLSTALNGAGFTVGSATNATARQEVTTVHYDATNAQAQAVAETVARSLGGVEVLDLPTPAPVESGLLPDGGTVLVMLGSDKADLTFEQMSAPTTVAPAGATTLPVTPST
jgi:hypothetical protein